MNDENLIAIETKRYSEFFRRLLEKYNVDSVIEIDGKKFTPNNFPQLIEEWCVNEKIRRTRDFKLVHRKIDLFGFHDNPDEMWAVESELPFIEKLAEEKILRFRIMRRHKA